MATKAETTTETTRYPIMVADNRRADFSLIYPTWGDIVKALQDATKTGESMGEYLRMSKDEQCDTKDVGGFVGGKFRPGVKRRIGGAVDKRSLITLDIDTDTDFAPTCLYIRHTTHSSTPTARRWRYIIPLSRQVDRTEYQALTRRVAEPVLDQVDPASYEPERLMFWPSVSSDGEYWSEVHIGEVLDPDLVLETYTDPRDPKEWSYGPTEEEKSYQHANRGGRMEDPTTKTGLVGAWCREYDCRDVLEMFPDLYERGNSYNRYTYKPGHSSNGVVLYEGGLFCYSNHSTDPLHGRTLNAFDLYRLLKFGTLDKDAKAHTRTDRLPSYSAMCKAVREDAKAGARYLEEARPDLDQFDAIDTTADEIIATKLETNAKGITIGSLTNCVTVLENDLLLSNHIKHDQFTDRVIITGRLPWERGERNDIWADTDDAALRVYLSKVYGLDATKDKIQDAMDYVLMQDDRQVHSIREYIQETEWDGVERLDTLFIRCLLADDTELVRAITRKSLVACVKRVFEPGCKYDYMTILISAEGIGKSTLLAKLGGKWFSDSFDFRQDGKGLMEQLDGNWIIESAELKGFSRQETTTIKAFLSKRDDRYRGAYNRRVSVLPRQCVFFGTTNEDSFLRDETGNRRFWTIACHQPEQTVSDAMLEIINDDGTLIRQIWAEAYHRYKEGESTELPHELKLEMKQVQGAYEYEDPLVAEAERYLSIRIPSTWDSWTKEQRKNYIQTVRMGTGRGSYPSLSDCSMEIRRRVCGEEFRNEWLSELDNGNKYTTHIATKTLGKLSDWEKIGRRTVTQYGRVVLFERIGFVEDVVENTISPDDELPF